MHCAHLGACVWRQGEDVGKLVRSAWVTDGPRHFCRSRIAREQHGRP